MRSDVANSKALAVAGFLLVVCSACARPPLSSTVTTPALPSFSMASSTPTAPTSDPATGGTSAPPTSTPNPERTVDVDVTLVWVTPGPGAIQAAAQVNDLVEDGGTCIMSASSGSTRLTVSSQAFANPQSTACGALSLSSVRTGAWDVTVEYSSAKHYGVSETKRVEVKS